MTLVLIAATTEPNSTWYEHCKSGSNECFSYIQGIYEATKATKTLCGTETFTAPAVAAHIIEFVSIPGNSKAKEIPFSTLVIATLESNYPCKR